ncbi:hypothetical protein [Colwellia sp. UCD-KL20]|uniref:hypothetical protein n=1 Tax=Colwellia sp. UCD-KL20 TaxID=1917165 RepID=UPI00097100F0|nr:hypothetical protein [Colwellia sp. UCD-KL20]
MDKLLIGVVCALIGVFIGHKLTIGRDKRKEFNDAIKPFKQRILSHQEDLQTAGYIQSPLEQNEFKSLRLYLGDKKYFHLIDLFKEYNAALENSGEIDNSPISFSVVYSDIECHKLAAIVCKINSQLQLK